MLIVAGLNNMTFLIIFESKINKDKVLCGRENALVQCYATVTAGLTLPQLYVKSRVFIITIIIS